MDIYTQVTLAFVILGFAAFFSAVIGYLASSSYRTRIDRLADKDRS